MSFITYLLLCYYALSVLTLQRVWFYFLLFFPSSFLFVFLPILSFSLFFSTSFFIFFAFFPLFPFYFLLRSHLHVVIVRFLFSSLFCISNLSFFVHFTLHLTIFSYFYFHSCVKMSAVIITLILLSVL